MRYRYVEHDQAMVPICRDCSPWRPCYPCDHPSERDADVSAEGNAEGDVPLQDVQGMEGDDSEGEGAEK